VLKRSVVMVTALAAVALVPSSPTAVGALTANALVRVAHFSPDTAGVDVWVDGKRALQNVGYNTVSDYVSLPAGDHAFALRPFGAAASSKPVVAADADLAADAAYTIAGVGLNKEIHGQIFEDDLGAPPAGNAKVRVIDAVVGTTPVDVELAGAAKFAGVDFAAASGYKSVKPGTYAVTVSTSDDGKSVLDVPSVRVGAGIIYSFAVIGGADKPLQLVPVVDARGVAETPVGAAATGGGGTARVRVNGVHGHVRHVRLPHDRRRPSK
jgi:hypothetical protein